MWRLLVLALGLSAVSGFLHGYAHLDYSRQAEAGPGAGEPLYLTPLLEAGNITWAKRLARVPFTDALGIKSYSGYFTVNKTYNSNQFLWYFPPIAAAPVDAPVVLWLQGGPGGSSLFGLFTENGPIRVRRNRFERRKYNWASNHHMIYIDNPVGTGFSFTNSSEGYVRNEVQVGRDLYSTLTQFFQLFPELRNNKFYITGESYAGKYVPALGYTIHKNNPTAKVKINLIGLAIGNGLSDPEHQLVYGEYLYQHGLLDSNQLAQFQSNEAQIKKYIQDQQWLKAFETFDSLLNGDFIDGKSLFFNFTGFEYYFNILKTRGDKDTDNFANLLNNSEIRRAIHVGKQPYNDGKMVEHYLKEDVMKSVAPWIAELLSHYYIVFYNGQLDIIVAYPLTENYLKKLNFSAADQYKIAKRYIWRVDGEVAGYVKSAGNLTEILVRNAGHMVPADQPKWALDLITRFTHEKTFY